MRKLVYYIAVSLDGYIAGPDAEVDFYPTSEDMIDWINARYPETVPGNIRPLAGLVGQPNRAFDTVLMGRGTYELVLDLPMSPYDHLRQYLVSSTLDVDDPAVTVIKEDPIGLVRRLKQEDSAQDIWLCGGGRLAGALLPEIDELIIKSYPVIAGTGVPMVSGDFDPTGFTLTDRVFFDNGAQVSWLTRS
ncbi:dihydrofolate reductase [Stackebrandtia endophytica]|uniref:Dihydrofolate reductase n=1 Tax=Stackebrandtia endophytica TaxID=1496996 RepID=A0A543AZ40_9ACTN|nr:dihydrofolate reductase family protein [Stackebrandtia endophytica]TQL77851.1 dihydrofolate reductase [Stackebrandtia endophytica]